MMTTSGELMMKRANNNESEHENEHEHEGKKPASFIEGERRGAEGSRRGKWEVEEAHHHQHQHFWGRQHARKRDLTHLRELIQQNLLTSAFTPSLNAETF